MPETAFLEEIGVAIDDDWPSQTSKERIEAEARATGWEGLLRWDHDTLHFASRDDSFRCGMSPRAQSLYPHALRLCRRCVRLERFRASMPGDWNLKRRLQDFRSVLAHEALRATGGNRNRAARALGVSRATFYRILDTVNHERPHADAG